ncbi:MAG: hypothetical protein UDG94_06200 [Peptococcaceae bacterium]|nr:hypothetical protein [Peptococcaceae bacterium]
MKQRPGNILILTLLVCTMLALVLMIGVEVAGLRSASRQNQIAGLQLEQLHRTALADGLDAANASGDTLALGRVLLADEPVKGQHRLLTVTAVEHRLLTVESTSSLDDGSQRQHHVQIFALPLEERFAFTRSERALYYDADRGVPDRWLENHAEQDLVVVCDRRPGDTYAIGSGGSSLHLSGSLYVTHLIGDDFSSTLHSALTSEGNAVFEGDLHLLGNLSCQTAWIDGTLTIGESVRLMADTVVLGEDVPDATLACIDAATIYMPHPPQMLETEATSDDVETEDSNSTAPMVEPVVRPLSELSPSAPEKTAYLMFWQLD